MKAFGFLAAPVSVLLLLDFLAGFSAEASAFRFGLGIVELGPASSPLAGAFVGPSADRGKSQQRQNERSTADLQCQVFLQQAGAEVASQAVPFIICNHVPSSDKTATRICLSTLRLKGHQFAVFSGVAISRVRIASVKDLTIRFDVLG